jgi:hypothetical protein
MAWGKDLRIRVEIKVDQPLVCGVPLKESEEESEGKWFDIKYERIPHFCFDCGRLVHSVEGCLAEKEEVKQWGEWLRATPRKPQKSVSSGRPAVSSGSYSSRLAGAGFGGNEGVSIRETIFPSGRVLLLPHWRSWGEARWGGCHKSVQ